MMDKLIKLSRTGDKIAGVALLWLRLRLRLRRGIKPVAKAVDEVDEVASGGSKGGTIYELDP